MSASIQTKLVKSSSTPEVSSSPETIVSTISRSFDGIFRRTPTTDRKLRVTDVEIAVGEINSEKKETKTELQNVNFSIERSNYSNSRILSASKACSAFFAIIILSTIVAAINSNANFGSAKFWKTFAITAFISSIFSCGCISVCKHAR